MRTRAIALGSGAGFVLAVVAGGLVNQLNGGWPWWVAAALVTLTAATLTGWLAAANSGRRLKIRNAADSDFEALDPGFEAGHAGPSRAGQIAPSSRFVQENSAAGGTVYANQGTGKQIIHPQARPEERYGSAG